MDIRAEPSELNQLPPRAMIAADEVRGGLHHPFTIAELVVAGVDEAAVRMTIEKLQLLLDLGGDPDIV